MKILKDYLSRKTFPKVGTVYKDQFGDHWFYAGNGPHFGDGGTYHELKQNKWGVWKVNPHLWIKKPPGMMFSGCILSRVDAS